STQLKISFTSQCGVPSLRVRIIHVAVSLTRSLPLSRLVCALFVCWRRSERGRLNKFKSALVAAVATGLVITAPGVGAVAFAQETAATANPANIDASKTATLTIHKHADADKTGGNDNGLKNPEFDGKKGLPGATFEVSRVKGYDLTKNADWEKLAKSGLDPATIDATQLENTQEVTTGADGSVAVQNLPLGLYLVKETKAPQGHNIGASKEFLVTLPMTNPQNRNAWNYDVHVYPKNKKVENPDIPTKTVKDANTKAGDKISYEATSPVQQYDSLTKFKVRDFYPADRLENGAVTSVKITGNKAGAASEAVLEASDYKVANDTAAGHLDITLTASGIAKVNEFAADADRKVVVGLDFTVKKIEGDVTAPIENKVGVGQDNTGTPGDDPEIPETPPETPKWPRSYYGDVKIVKTGSENKALKGVKFDVYRCNSPEDIAVTPLIKDAATTDADGTAIIRGLQANNWVNNQEWPLEKKAAQDDPRDYLAYCLVETETVPGHELLAQPVKFQIVANDATKTVPLVEQAIKNNPTNGGFELPLTGGQGVLFLLAGGVLLLVMAGGATYVLRRREA
ncbi:TPA: SpaH/EbpB family LPXTG-anchored major pilin, partial [Corynebacterium striatum]|nr:SpaH/EbpB family LPXTG-anchored major pilin [Corynebacterium striatum]